MRKNIIGFLVGCLVVACLSFKTVYDTKNSTAEVEQIDGYLIFTDCKPVKDYEFLGTVKSGVTLGSEQYQGVRDRLIKKIKKEYPKADGIIFRFVDGGADKAEAIKFK